MRAKSPGPTAPKAERLAAPAPAVASEILTIVAPGQASLPQRRCAAPRAREVDLAQLLQQLSGAGSSLVELHFRKGLEARAPASIRALAADLACYARFSGERGGIGLPADDTRIVAYIDHCEARRLKPATVSRRLSSLSVAHRMLGFPSPVGAGVVRDALRGFKRRVGTRQRQADPLRFGKGVGRDPAKGFTLLALLEACPRDIVGLRDAALLSLGYDAGLRVSELVAVEFEHIERSSDGSGLLELVRSKTDQDGAGAWAWLSPDTLRRVDLWCEAASIGSGALFRRIAVTRTKEAFARRALAVRDLAYNARLDRQRMSARKDRPATVRYDVGARPLTPAAVRLIIKRVALASADQGFTDLVGLDLIAALEGLSTHSLRVGLTQDLFASGEDAGPIAQALRWTSTATALRYGRKLAPASNAAARMLSGLRK